ncbi:type II toxin-antitoxin system RelE/ParE family toxin [Candidatus Daviesbacteria bacterium]|nr:type II toxin-antitoxin system RelE/ParE family toxin [Candidatus Daviesbacteria bacterium]
MDQKWEIIYYETSQGNSPVFEFIQNLDPKIKSKVIGVMDLLKELGTLIGPPHSKKVTGTPLWELRILGGDNIRIFYVAVVNRRFLLLHVFLKKKQKTDTKEIKTAINRLDDYKSRLKTDS